MAIKSAICLLFMFGAPTGESRPPCGGRLMLRWRGIRRARGAARRGRRCRSPGRACRTGRPGTAPGHRAQHRTGASQSEPRRARRAHPAPSRMCAPRSSSRRRLRSGTSPDRHAPPRARLAALIVAHEAQRRDDDGRPCGEVASGLRILRSDASTAARTRAPGVAAARARVPALVILRASAAAHDGCRSGAPSVERAVS